MRDGGLLSLGVDVGSTTAKIVLSDGGPKPLAWRYVRHQGDLAGTLRRALIGLAAPGRTVRPFVTGGGGRLLAERLGAPYVHEVTAAAAAVRRRHADAGALVDLGGQDAKLVVFDRDAAGAIRRSHAGMNDRCAAGTGVTVDRCLLRLGVDGVGARGVAYRAERVRALSSKCGVFAETDLVNMARAGAPVDDLVCSLADAIVVQNLAVLARGLTPRPRVILLGGPHVHLPALAGAWRRHLAALWRERPLETTAGAGQDAGARAGGDRDGDGDRDAVLVPEDALLYAALGACEAGEARAQDEGAQSAMTLAALGERLDGRGRPVTGTAGRAASRPAGSAHARLALEAGPQEQPFDAEAGERAAQAVARGAGPDVPPGRARPVAIGIDAGSTACKAVAVDAAGRLLVSRSCASREPVADARALLARLEAALGGLPVQALGVTGYGAGAVGAVFGADVNVVETAAHARAARAFVPDADVVCDVGGQDVKVLALDGRGGLRDFRLSSQCHAGIGMVLEAAARELGVPLDGYAAHAFAARRAARFGDGCVVFLDADRVTFQRQGFSPDEILAGLARALPRVVWEQIMNGTPPAALGRRFVLQGGVQRNPAAVAAQMEYLGAAVPGARVSVHPYPAEAGALGAALCALDGLAALGARGEGRRRMAFGDAVGGGAFAVRADESTRCRLCPSRCPRSFVDVTRADGGRLTHVAGNACEEGAHAEARGRSPAQVRRRKRVLAPNLLSDEARLLFSATLADEVPLRPAPRRVRVGIPRILAQYRAAPFFRGYLQALGVRPDDVVFSPPTSDGLWRRGAAHGASDPCFPVKVTLAHVHDLVHRVHDAGRPLDALLVPAFTHALTPVRHALDCASCPVVTASPALARAAFEADGDLARRGIALLDGPVTIHDRPRLRAQMHAAFGGLLAASPRESDAAVEAGFRAMGRLDQRLQASARAVLERLDREARGCAVLVLCRPYHADPGLNHRLGEELQALGCPVLSIRSLPRDQAYLGRLFARDLGDGRIEDAYDVRDLDAEAANSGAIERLWAARFAARHGRIAVVDLSSFKCAQDAPVQAATRALLDEAGVVTCALHDLDETRAVGSMRLRLRTFAHALRARELLA